MSLCNRLIRGVVNLHADAIDKLASFWQTPREVEWAKAAADGLAKREAETEVGDLSTYNQPAYFAVEDETYADTDYTPLPRAYKVCNDCGQPMILRHYCQPPETSATTPGAVDGPAEGEPPEPSAGVDWLGRSDRDSLWRLSGALDPVEAVKYGWHDDCWSWTDDGGETWRPSHAQRGVILPAPSGEQWIKAPSAEVEPPASAPSAESPTPEFDWVTTAIPVIAGVLAGHVPSPQCNYILCLNTRRETCGEFDNWADWRNHVAPHIAVDIQSDCLVTAYDFASGDRPRPLADFPKHQK